MENAVSNEKQPVKQPRSGRRIVVAITLSIFTGFLAWHYLSKLNDYQPVYHLQLPIHQSHFEILMVGPWLVTMTSTDRHVGLCNFEFRHLETGVLAYELRDQRHLIYPRPMTYLPAQDSDQNEGLITHQLNDAEASVALIQPQLRMQKTLLDYTINRYFANSSFTAEYYCKFDYFDLEPFSTLAHSGLLGNILTAFQHYLADDCRSLTGVYLIKVYATRTGQCISTSTLPTRWDYYCVPKLLDDGDHLLVHFTRGPAYRLGPYLLKQYTTPEQRATVAANMSGLMLFNHRTGKVVKEWIDLKSVALQQIDRDCILIHTTTIEPIEQWGGLSPDKFRRHLLLDTKTFQTIELPTDLPIHMVNIARAENGYQLLLHENLPSDPTSTKYTWKLLSQSGQVEQTIKWNGNQRITENLISRQPQMCLVESFDGTFHELWRNWTKRFPLLKMLPWEPKITTSLLDLGTQQHLLSVENSSLISYTASQDGKRLLIATRNAGTPDTCDVKVYALPITPHAWWIHWLPYVAGFLVADVFWQLVRKAGVKVDP